MNSRAYMRGLVLILKDFEDTADRAPCRYGHIDCATKHDGPCLDSTVHEMAAMTNDPAWLDGDAYPELLAAAEEEYL